MQKHVMTILLGLLCATSAQAREGQFMIGARGSFLFDSELTEIVGGDTPTSGRTEGELSEDFGFSVAIGRSFAVFGDSGDLVIEVEFMDHPTEENQQFGPIQVRSEFNTEAFMANFYWRSSAQTFVPYVGGGLGSADLTLKSTALNDPSFAPFAESASGFAYQLMAGLRYRVTDRLSLGAGYRYFVADDIENDVADPFGTPLEVAWDLTTQRAEIELMFRF